MEKLILVVYTAVAACLDLKGDRIPNAWALAGALAGLAWGIRQYGALSLARLLPALVLTGSLWQARKKGGIGGGDIKLFAGCALCLPPLRYPFFLLGSLAAAAGAAAFRILRGEKREDLLRQKIHLAPAALAGALLYAAGLI